MMSMMFAPKLVYVSNTTENQMESAPPGEAFRTKDEPETLADVRAAMSRGDNFDPSPEHYANESSTSFEVEVALEALSVEGEVLA